MEVASWTLAGAFLVGLAHTLEPCEDKAVVSLFVLWGAKRLKEGIFLVILYGLGMALIDTVLGVICAYAGLALLQEYEVALKVVAGAVTVGFGVLMLVRPGGVHLGHHHGEKTTAVSEPIAPRALSIFGLGLIRGLPPCPVELAVLAWATSMGSVLRGGLFVLLFGLGTTLGLIPLGLVMSGIAGATRRTRYQSVVPRFAAMVMLAVGLFLALSPLWD